MQSPAIDSRAVRACTNCVRAKAKCSPSVNATESCDRCFRLHKTCQPSAPIRKRGPASSQLPATRVLALEAKLDGLTSLLQLQSAQSTPSPLPPPTAALAPGEAVWTLTLFRQHCLAFFPVVAITESATPQQIQQEKPLLWAAIAAVATPSAAQHRRLSLQMRELIGREAHVKGTCCIDFLLAVMVYTAWDRHRGHHDSLLSNLVQQAVAIVYDLGLHAPPPDDTTGLALTYDLKGTLRPSRLTRSETIEERRTLLACYLLGSGTSRQSLCWTSYFDECLTILEQQKESEGDVLLVLLVRLRLIAEMASSAWSEAKDTSHLASTMLHLRLLEGQLRDFRSGIPSHLLQNKALLLELHNTEILIHEIGLADIFPGGDLQRINHLLACVQSTKDWSETFVTIPPANFFGFTAAISMQKNHVLVTYFRLSSCECPSWDRNLVLDQLDFNVTLDRMIAGYAQVKNEVPIDTTQEIDVFSMMESKIRSAKTSWATRLGYIPSVWDLLSLDEMSMEMFV